VIVQSCKLSTPGMLGNIQVLLLLRLLVAQGRPVACRCMHNIL
jgi:hypothetical protein